MRVVLVDPALFTAPYDAALTEGLLACGVQPLWMTRPKRWRDQDLIPREFVEELFSRRIDAPRMPGLLRAMIRAIAHAVGLVRLATRVRKLRPDAVHFQWILVPALDALVMRFIRRTCPVVLTLHDTVPVRTYGGVVSALQTLGLRFALRSADRIIVHTRAGKERLIANKVAAHSIVVIPHGPLQLTMSAEAPAVRDARWRFVLFGELKPYKGLEVLIEAAAKIPVELAAQAHIIVAGRSCMDLKPIAERIAQLGLQCLVELRPWRHAEEEMAQLFARTDTFVFPYREIDASGVYYLVKHLGKWLIASRVGIFLEDLPESAGELFRAGDSDGLAQAMASAIVDRPAGIRPIEDQSWAFIGGLTRAAYLSAAKLPPDTGEPRGAPKPPRRARVHSADSVPDSEVIG